VRNRNGKRTSYQTGEESKEARPKLQENKQ